MNGLLSRGSQVRILPGAPFIAVVMVQRFGGEAMAARFYWSSDLILW